jgi:lysophospholipase L1-like esterase
MNKKNEIDPHYIHRTSIFRESTVKHGSIVFLGDSITEMCEWQEFFPNCHIINRGISGDSSYGVLERLDEVLSLKPAKIFITIGINDLQRHYDTTEVIFNIRKIIDEIIENSGAKIFLQSILPIIESKLSTGIKNSTINFVNKELELFSKSVKIEFINNNKLLADDSGNLRYDLSSDGLHINGKAYKIWINNISDKVNE